MAKISPLLLIGGGLVALELFRPGSTPLRSLLPAGGLRWPASSAVAPVVEPLSLWERLGLQAGSAGLTWIGGALGDWLRTAGSAEAAPLPALPDTTLWEGTEYPWLDTFDWATVESDWVPEP